MNFYADITKVEERDDGTIMVYGTASADTRDDTGEIITAAAMKAALPGYFAIGGTGALREMHLPSAAGKVDEASVDADGVTRIGAHVVDPLAITKVRAGVYKGFSVGGKVTSRDPKDPTTITGIKLVEISLVDRPAHPEAVITMWKADMADPEPDAMPKPYAPTNDEVKAEAEAMAKAAGKTASAYKDFVVKARAGLIAKATEGETTVISAADTVAVEAETLDEDGEIDKAAAPETDPEEPTEIDPAAALALALGKAAEAAKPAQDDAPASPVTIGLEDAGKALAAITKAIEANPLAKGLWEVSRLAEIIRDLCFVQSSAVWEAQVEGDGSPIPQSLATSIQQLGATLIAWTQEEVAELLAEMAERGGSIEIVIVDDDADMALAAGLIDLVKADTALMEKVGARHSKGDMAKIQAMHDHTAGLGAKCDKANCEKAEGADDLAKALADNDRLKAALTGATPQVEELGKTIAALTERLAKIEAQPLPAKTAAGPQAVSKEADASGAGATANAEAVLSAEFRKALDELPPEQRGELLLRIALKQPRIINNDPRASA